MSCALAAACCLLFPNTAWAETAGVLVYAGYSPEGDFQSVRISDFRSRGGLELIGKAKTKGDQYWVWDGLENIAPIGNVVQAGQAFYFTEDSDRLCVAGQGEIRIAVQSGEEIVVNLYGDPSAYALQGRIRYAGCKLSFCGFRERYLREYASGAEMSQNTRVLCGPNGEKIGFSALEKGANELSWVTTRLRAGQAEDERLLEVVWKAEESGTLTLRLEDVRHAVQDGDGVYEIRDQMFAYVQ